MKLTFYLHPFCFVVQITLQVDQTQQESLSSQSTIPIYLPESHQAIKKITEKIAEVRTQQQQEEEHRRKLIILHQQQQIQQCEAAARIREGQIICKKKQQDQCNFPAVPITDNIPFNNYYYRNLNNTAKLNIESTLFSSASRDST